MFDINVLCMNFPLLSLASEWWLLLSRLKRRLTKQHPVFERQLLLHLNDCKCLQHGDRSWNHWWCLSGYRPSHCAPHGALAMTAGTANHSSPWDIQRVMHHENWAYGRRFSFHYKYIFLNTVLLSAWVSHWNECRRSMY